MPSRQLVSQEDSAQIQGRRLPRSRFTGRWGRIMAFDAGYLVPFMVDEVLPGDHLSYNVTAYARLSTPLFPLFSNQRLDTHFFFVPNRIIWNNWVKQHGEQVNPTDSIAFVTPQITSPANGWLVGSLFDHFGLPTVGQLGAGATISHISLPFRAYNLIYNTWFRDQNLINSAADNRASDGPDNPADYVLRRRAKSHDYFTSALPWAQKFTAPTIPIAGTAPVSGIGFAAGLVGDAINQNVFETGDTTTTLYGAAALGSNPDLYFDIFPLGGGNNAPNIYADLSQATGVAINTFRQAFMIQELLERDARGGTRYNELIESHFGVRNPDARLQRPEYIGGGQTNLNITPIAQTAPTAGVPLGALGAAGTAAGGSHRASYAATEYGYIIGLISIKTELAYQQGIHRMWHRNTRYDWYYPEFAGLGEQAILKREIFADGSGTDVDIFGYQERWHEYRQRYSEITGIFRSTAASTLDAWHLAERFATVPSLNQTFIEDNPPMSRVLSLGGSAVGQQYLADIDIRRVAVRPLPLYGTPQTLSRF